MRLIRRSIPYLLILVLVSVIWVWWNRPKKVDMAAYVPADALLYLEANNLPLVISGLTNSDGWKSLAEPAGIKPGLGSTGWLGRFAAWTGIGSADTILFSRMQIAAVVLGVAAADGGETLNVRPQIALVVETHSSERRTLASIEKHVGNFARRAYSDPFVEQKEIDGVHWIVWNSVSSERRIVAAVVGSVAIIGNHETSVQTCLAVLRGQRPSLAGNVEMEDARRRMTIDGALTFGFMSSEGARKLAEVAAAVYLGQVSEGAEAQGIAANILPQIANKIIGSVAWCARTVDGRIEDKYFISTRNDSGARLRSALALTTPNPVPASAFLPPDTYSLTRYSTQNPLTAWRGLSFSVSSQLDPVLAVMVPPFLKATLGPYGIEDPDAFLQAVGPTIVTARIENGSGSTVLLVEVRDETVLKDFVTKKLGTSTPQVEVVGSAELLSSPDEKRGAASFLKGNLLIGPKASVRRCLEAIQHEQTLVASKTFQTTLGAASLAGQSHILTLTSDSEAAREFIVFVASQPAAHGPAVNAQELETRIGALPYAVTEMTFVEGGIERRTSSSFGQLGMLAKQFATKK